MQDQASTYSRPSAPSILGADGKLSSASAAASLKYARPQDLPSYPSTGGVQMSSAGAAANLASNNQKTFEHWKPDPIPAANKAALLAKDYTMQPLWQPEASKAGSKAALTAHANPNQIEPMQPKRTKPPQPSPAYDTAANSRSKALMAANAVHNRRRSDSLPVQPVTKTQGNVSWAQQAAAKSHGSTPPSRSGAFAPGDPGFEASRVQNVPKDNASRQLYTSTPPVSIETQEKKRQDLLRASAVAMARKMYAIQQKHIDEAAGRPATRVRSATVGGSSKSVSEDLNAAGGSYENLEEAARRLAQERLAKIHDEHAEYRNYYGAKASPPRSRLPMRLRRKISGTPAGDDSDEENSRKIRSQMSIFQSKLAEVDSKKRQQDRDALLVIAHRNVDAQIAKLDEKVFRETGKASPAQMEKWQRSARDKAQRDSDERMQNTGKVHIGGGKYIDQSEVDAIAKARLQPTLDDIAYKADQQRALDEEARIEKLKKEQQAEAEKIRAALDAAELKVAKDKQKEEEKARKTAEKQEKQEVLDAEKQRRKSLAAANKERDRLEKEEKKKAKGEKPRRLSTLLGRGSVSAGGAATAAAAEASSDETTSESEDSSRGAKASPEEPSVHDQVTAPKDTAPKDTAPKDTAPKDTAPKDTDPKDTTPGDTTLKDTTPKDTATDATSSEPVAAPALEDQAEATEGPSTDGDNTVEKRGSVDEEKEGPASPAKGKSRVKSWMKVRFRSKSGSQQDNEVMPALAENDADESTRPKDAVTNGDTPEKDTSRPDSMRDVAMAGRFSNESDDLYGPPRDISPPGSKGSRDNLSRDRSPSISSLSSHYSEETKDAKPEEATIEEAKVVDLKPQTSDDATETEADQRGRSGFKARLLKKITPNKGAINDDKSMTPITSNATNDEYEEAKDTFEEGKLSPPPPLSALTAEGTEGNNAIKTLSPKTSREQSRFTEDL